MKDATEKWIELAEQDMGMADAAWSLRFYSACVAHCEQAIEKILKAGLAEREIQFRKTHDLLELARLWNLDLDDVQVDFLTKLTEQYLPSRYGDVHIEYSAEVAENYFVQTKGMYAWLRPQLS